MADNAPVGNTCPDIDNIIDLLEELREANYSLREWGNDLYDQVEAQESTIASLEKEIVDLKIDYAELEKEIEAIKEEV